MYVKKALMKSDNLDDWEGLLERFPSFQNFVSHSIFIPYRLQLCFHCSPDSP